MKREWKPGDVALASYEGEVKVYLYGRKYDTNNYRWISDDGSTSVKFELADWWRPLVVIDPEDRQQVEQLVKALSTGQPLVGLDPTNRRMVDQAWVTHTQTALREFANPTLPKPEEPTGLGAVVEDAGGDTWTRNAGARWLNLDGGSSSSSWSDLRAVRVIFEGVTS